MRLLAIKNVSFCGGYFDWPWCWAPKITGYSLLRRRRRRDKILPRTRFEYYRITPWTPLGRFNFERLNISRNPTRVLPDKPPMDRLGPCNSQKHPRCGINLALVKYYLELFSAIKIIIKKNNHLIFTLCTQHRLIGPTERMSWGNRFSEKIWGGRSGMSGKSRESKLVDRGRTVW